TAASVRAMRTRARSASLGSAASPASAIEASTSSARSAPVSATSSSSSPSASSIREKPSRMSPVRCDCRSLLTMRAASDDVHLRLELERRDLVPIALELLALVREHVAEHGLAERLGDELAVLHRRHSL